jgi:hypothetical protein
MGDEIAIFSVQVTLRVTVTVVSVTVVTNSWEIMLFSGTDNLRVFKRLFLSPSSSSEALLVTLVGLTSQYLYVRKLKGKKYKDIDLKTLYAPWVQQAAEANGLRFMLDANGNIKAFDKNYNEY